MKIIEIKNDNSPVDRDADVLVSELSVSYLQGIRDAAGIDPILIGNNGTEIQVNRKSVPFYTKYKTLSDALKGLTNNEF